MPESNTRSTRWIGPLLNPSELSLLQWPGPFRFDLQQQLAVMEFFKAMFLRRKQQQAATTAAAQQRSSSPALPASPAVSASPQPKQQDQQPADYASPSRYGKVEPTKRSTGNKMAKKSPRRVSPAGLNSLDMTTAVEEISSGGVKKTPSGEDVKKTRMRKPKEEDRKEDKKETKKGRNPVSRTEFEKVAAPCRPAVDKTKMKSAEELFAEHQARLSAEKTDGKQLPPPTKEQQGKMERNQPSAQMPVYSARFPGTDLR